MNQESEKGEKGGAKKATHEFGGDTLAGEMPANRAGDRVFGRYELKRILGVGGMGVVWLATDEKLDQEVALKFVPDTLRHDEAAIDDLKKQTKIGLKLSHPNIVRVAGFEDDGEHSAIVMEYVDGPTLAAMRIDQPAQVFEADVLHPYVAQLLDALEYAHTSAGMVHRDLKPANLMVNANDHIKVTDFGIACSIRDSVSRLTLQQKAGSGTLLYMSPQQMLGTAPPSESDDIYSLGVTLFELMTGAPPFYSGDVQTQIKEIPAPSVTERRVQEEIAGDPVPPHWETVIQACLEKDPHLRPSNVGEVRKGLAGQRFARGSSARRTATKTQHGHPAPAAGGGRGLPSGGMLAAGAAAAIALVLGIWFVANRGSNATVNGNTPVAPEPVAPEPMPVIDLARADAERELERLQGLAEAARTADEGTDTPTAKLERWSNLVKQMKDFVYPYSDDALVLQREAASQMSHWMVEEALEAEVGKQIIAEVEETLQHARDESERADLDASTKAALWAEVLSKLSALDFPSQKDRLATLVTEAGSEKNKWDTRAASETPKQIPNETQFFASRGSWNAYGKRQLLRKVQGELRTKSHYPQSPDGSFGPLTYAAVLSYQKDEVLPRTGVLDEPTLERLGLDTMTEPAYVAESRPRSNNSGRGRSSSGENSNDPWGSAIRERIRSGGSLPAPPPLPFR